jgi:hypothetical protein
LSFFNRCCVVCFRLPATPALEHLSAVIHNCFLKGAVSKDAIDRFDESKGIENPQEAGSVEIQNLENVRRFILFFPDPAGLFEYLLSPGPAGL